VQEDEFRRAILGRVALFALVGRKIACPPLAGAGVVTLIGSSER
jgi:hypothetical protein